MPPPRVEMHFLDHLSCGHDVHTSAFVNTPENIIALMMEFAWAVPCYDCPKVDGHTALVQRESVEFLGYEELPA